MKNNLHLWICLAACLGVIGWEIGERIQARDLETKSFPAMGLAWYELGKKVKVSQDAHLPSGLLVKSLDGYAAKGFISEREWDSRQEAKRFRNQGREQLAALFESESEAHRRNFQSSGRIAWIINHTGENIKVQTYFFPLMIREAMDAEGRWRPVEYVSLGYLNNGFDELMIYPDEALPFHYEPFSGDYKTKLRFKILGADRFYYSEPFTGYIEYGQFEEAEGAMSRYHYKLEEFKHFVPKWNFTCWAED